MRMLGKRLKSNQRSLLLLLWVSTAVLVLVAALVVVRWNRQITREREQAEVAARVDVLVTPLRPPSNDGITTFLDSADVRATALWNGVRYFATSGGLIAMDESGGLKRRYTTLDGLTDNDLTALAIFRDRLFIGTATAGMMAFDGNGFTGFRFQKPKAARVNTLLANESNLLIGTFGAGLLAYDGEQFNSRLTFDKTTEFTNVTVLLEHQSRLYVGSQDQGLYRWREAQWAQFTTREGLPSARVTGLAVAPGSGEIVVATDFGVVTLNDADDISSLSTQPNITSLCLSRGQLYAGLFSGGLVKLPLDTGDQPRFVPVTDRLPPTTSRPPAIAYADAAYLWALTREGAYARDEGANSPSFEPVYQVSPADRLLTAAHVTSLALDRDGRLWVGYFDRGLDLISMEPAERLLHIEDDRIREVNHLAFDGHADRLLVATSGGLVSLDNRLKQSVRTRQDGGLIDNAVAHVSLVEDTAGGREGRLIVATAGGLTEYSQGRARSVSAFHGLSSNHLYTSASVGSRLFVGSLAGVIELSGLRVVRVLKKSNSKLSEDWVTALTEAEGTLYIGTIGGLDALLPSGEMINFADELGAFEVNLNALHFDGERLYVGTSDRGLLAYNVRDRRWSRLSAGLTSANVTAIVSDDRFIYVGTLNGLGRIEKRIIR